MDIEQRLYTQAQGWSTPPDSSLAESAQLVLAFGASDLLKTPGLFEQMKNLYPGAHILGCSTAGEIFGTTVNDDSLSLTAVCFNHTRLSGAQIALDPSCSSLQISEELVAAIPLTLPDPETRQELPLRHVFVLSDGLHVNGSELVEGLVRRLPPHVTITGGLAADGPRFEETRVFFNQPPQPDSLAILGLYGHHLKIGFGSLGGWDTFGPERLITRSKDNILYELDGQSALGLYKKYLGDQAQGLPATGLLFPLSVRTDAHQTGLVRTILAVNEADQSLTYAGNVPEGAYGRLMKANFDRLVDGAVEAARTSLKALQNTPPQLAILISCVGRKLVLRQRVEEEVEGVRDILGENCPLTGFYSYGEISPFSPGAKCELHNQTMTITVLSED